MTDNPVDEAPHDPDLYGAIHFAFYDPATGSITQTGNMAPAHIRQQAQDTKMAWLQVESHVHWSTHKVDLSTRTCVPYTPPAPQKDFSQLRQEAYPPIEDFVDAVYWQGKGDPSKLTDYLAKVEAVKARFKKPAVTPTGNT